MARRGSSTSEACDCGEGECGACSILLGGEPVNSCLVPAIQAQGADITTIEGIGSPGLRHAVQQAFLDHGSAQCGICTPGMVITAAWMVEKKLPADEVARTLAGNLCRCTGYSAIIEAVQAAIVAAQGSRG